MEKIIGQYLIEHWSKSSLVAFLSNRLAWKKRYVLKIYNSKTSPSALLGQMAHKALEEFFNGMDEEYAIAEGLKYIDKYMGAEINYGKTGSREKTMTDYARAVKYYFEEMPNYYEKGTVMGAEIKHTCFITGPNGEKYAIPAKAHVDLVWRSNKTKYLEIHDAKFTTAYTDQAERNWGYIIQAMFNYFIVLDKFGEAPSKMIFKECKISQNKNGDPQVQDYEIVFAEHPEYFDIFYKLYNDCTKEIMKADIAFLPNPNDMFDGEDAMEVYAQDLLSIDLSDIEVTHKTKVAEIREVKYRASAHDKVENEFITEEEKIRLKFAEFGIPVEMKETITSPHVTLYTAKPSRGVRMSTIDKHADDLKIALKATKVRILAPIPGTDTIGIEIANKTRSFVAYSSVVVSGDGLLVPMGIDSYNRQIFKDLRDMPHLLVAGTTGSGKSVFVNVLIKSITEQMSSEDLSLILIDMKRVELTEHAHLPHLETGVIVDEKSAAKALKWLVDEMERRYEVLQHAGVKNIRDYMGQMKYMVVVIDEFADLILGEFGDVVESQLVKLAQKSRAVGIHLVVATQRPSVNVVTGILKANIATRICFMTASQIDSKVVLDQAGAEELTGKGDCLFLDPSKTGLQRLQAFSYE